MNPHLDSIERSWVIARSFAVLAALVINLAAAGSSSWTRRLRLARGFVVVVAVVYTIGNIVVLFTGIDVGAFAHAMRPYSALPWIALCLPPIIAVVERRSIVHRERTEIVAEIEGAGDGP